MPATRSSTRLATVQNTPSTTASAQTAAGSGGVKRKSPTATASSTVEKKVKKSRTKANAANSATSQGLSAQEAVSAQQASSTVASGGQAEEPEDEDTPVPATLTFNFEQGQTHLINIDARFQDLFDKMPCRPFEHLEQVHPFR
jgi:DNA-3-methyladenine glycosylase II